MPRARSVRATAFTSRSTSTKSPVMAAMPPAIGWKIRTVGPPMAGSSGGPAAEHPGHHGRHFLIEEDQIAHDHRVGPLLLERRVRAEGERRLHRHALHGDAEVGARHADAEDVAGLELSGLPERALHGRPVGRGGETRRGGADADDAVPPKVAQGLLADGIDVRTYRPRRPTAADVEQATTVVAFGCDLGELAGRARRLERWDDVPAVSEDFAKARDAIVHRVTAL